MALPVTQTPTFGFLMKEAARCFRGTRSICLLTRAPTIVLPVCNNPYKSANRQIYCRTSIGLDKLEDSCRRFELYMSKPRNEVKKEHSEKIDLVEFNPNDISRLKELTILADDDSQCFDIIDQYLEKHHASIDEIEVRKVRMAIFRVCFKKNDVDRVLNYVNDQTRFGKFFSSNECYRLALTMLYNQGRYNDVLASFDEFYNKDQLAVALGFRERCRVIALASLARLNTPEALDKATKLIDVDLDQVNYGDLCKKFTAYLALNHGRLDIAEDLLESVDKRGITSHGLKIQMLIMKGEMKQLLEYLQQLVTSPLFRLPSDLYQSVKEATEKFTDEEQSTQIKNLIEGLEANERLSNITMHQALFRTIADRKDLRFNTSTQQDFYRNNRTRTDRPMDRYSSNSYQSNRQRPRGQDFKKFADYM